MATLDEKRNDLIRALRDRGVTNSPVRRADIAEANSSLGKSASVPAWILSDASRRAGRGLFHIPEVATSHNATAPKPTPAPVAAPAAVFVKPAPAIKSIDEVPSATLAMTGGERASLIPDPIDTYVPFGHFNDLERIVAAGIFYPCFITGLSGNGKTTMIDQICARHGRELYRINITGHTDEDDLLGGMRLIDGDMVWVDGPVVAAMKRGAVLLLDEVDLAREAIMALQPVLEGKGVFLKKTGEWVRPAPGFQIFATANTKGKGDDSGKFISTNVLNEAFLDRFPVCVEQSYPSKSVERKILTKVMKENGVTDVEFVKNLVEWADKIRTCYYEDAVDEIITTRRLVNICTGYAVFQDRRKSIDMAISRFDESTKEAFLALYSKVDASIEENENASEPNE